MEFNWKQNIPDLATLQQRKQLAPAEEDSVMNGPYAWMAKPYEQNAAAEAEAEAAFQNSSQAYHQAMQNQMAQEAQKQADMQRIQELQNKIAERKKAVMDDPRMQIAAMLAMGGQPSALSSMLVSDLQKDIQAKQKKADEKKAAQTALDALENSLSTNMMVLSKTDKDQIDRFNNVTLPLFWNKFYELTDAGAVSRMGGVDAWLEELKRVEHSGVKKDSDKKALEEALRRAALRRRGGE